MTSQEPSRTIRLRDEEIARLDETVAPEGAPRCPGCGLIMSNREASEQGACNECNGGAYDPRDGWS